MLHRTKFRCGLLTYTYEQKIFMKTVSPGGGSLLAKALAAFFHRHAHKQTCSPSSKSKYWLLSDSLFDSLAVSSSNLPTHIQYHTHTVREHTQIDTEPLSPHPTPILRVYQWCLAALTAVRDIHTAHCSSLLFSVEPDRNWVTDAASEAQSQLQSWAAPPAWFCLMDYALHSREIVGTGRAWALPSRMDRQRQKQPVPASESPEHGPSALLQRCGTSVCV